MINREQMVTALKGGICRVVFTKVNGDKRDMTCTLNMDKIPANARPGSSPEKVEASINKSDAIPVYDVNAKGWRSFKVGNVELFEQ